MTQKTVWAPPSPCRVDEYDALLEHLDRAFEKPERGWFRRHLYHVLQPDERSVQRHLLLRHEGRLAGAMGIYPMRFRTRGVELSVGGVGQVAVAHEYRSQGGLGMLLRAGIEQMEREGLDLSWLGGERFRYQRHGWDHGGTIVVYIVERSDLDKNVPRGPAWKELANPAGRISDLQRAYRRRPAYIARSTREFALHLARPTFEWRVGEASGKLAYLVAPRETPRIIAELSGDPEVAIELLRAHVERHSLSSVEIEHPVDRTSLGRMMAKISDRFTMRPSGQLRIVSLDRVFAKLYLTDRALSPARRRALLALSASHRRLLVRRALGFLPHEPNLPKRVEPLAPSEPIRFFLSMLDQV